MRLRTFTAPDMQTAMRQVREALGDEAIILSSKEDKGKGVSVTAAVEQKESGEWRAASDGQKKLSPRTTRHSPLATDLRFQTQEILRFHNLPELFIAKILNANRDAWRESPRHCLEALLAAFFRFEPLHLDDQIASKQMTGKIGSSGHRVIGSSTSLMLIGPPGIGKTLTIARIATRLAMQKQPLTVVTTDNKRAGGIEQLQAFTRYSRHPACRRHDTGRITRPPRRGMLTYVRIDRHCRLQSL